MAHFIYNDINSKSLGIIVNVLPERTIPAERKELINQTINLLKMRMVMK